MNLRRILIVTVLTDAVLSLGSVFIESSGVAIRDPYPDLDMGYGLWFPMHGMFILAFFGLLALAWVGIVRFWNPARFLYLTAWAISLANHGLADSYNAAGWYYTLYNLVAVVGGFLIALIFCTDLRHRYGAPPPEVLPQAAT